MLFVSLRREAVHVAMAGLRDWLGILLAAVATGAVYLTARVEEQENLRNFGAEYAEYMRETHMFIPFVF